jgi:hypothetical protein
MSIETKLAAMVFQMVNFKKPNSIRAFGIWVLT